VLQILKKFMDLAKLEVIVKYNKSNDMHVVQGELWWDKIMGL
jgi:hypothetical protein